MSLEAMVWAMRTDRVRSAAERLLLIYLSERASTSDGEALWRPDDVERFESWAQLPPDSASDAMAGLLDARVLTPLGKRGDVWAVAFGPALQEGAGQSLGGEA